MAARQQVKKPRSVETRVVLPLVHLVKEHRLVCAVSGQDAPEQFVEPRPIRQSVAGCLRVGFGDPIAARLVAVSHLLILKSLHEPMVRVVVPVARAQTRLVGSALLSADRRQAVIAEDAPGCGDLGVAQDEQIHGQVGVPVPADGDRAGRCSRAGAIPSSWAVPAMASANTSLRSDSRVCCRTSTERAPSPSVYAAADTSCGAWADAPSSTITARSVTRMRSAPSGGAGS
jgi:hypothetical protein